MKGSAVKETQLSTLRQKSEKLIFLKFNDFILSIGESHEK